MSLVSIALAKRRLHAAAIAMRAAQLSDKYWPAHAAWLEAREAYHAERRALTALELAAWDRKLVANDHRPVTL
jgi:hypothetical protein